MNSIHNYFYMTDFGEDIIVECEVKITTFSNKKQEVFYLGKAKCNFVYGEEHQLFGKKDWKTISTNWIKLVSKDELESLKEMKLKINKIIDIEREAYFEPFTLTKYDNFKTGQEVMKYKTQGWD